MADALALFRVGLGAELAPVNVVAISAEAAVTKACEVAGVSADHVTGAEEVARPVVLA